MTLKTKLLISLVLLAIVCAWLMWYLPNTQPSAPPNHIADSNEMVGEVEAIVRELQDKVGVDVDGKIGPVTMKAVNDRVDKDNFNKLADRSIHTTKKDVNDINIVRSGKK